MEVIADQLRRSEEYLRSKNYTPEVSEWFFYFPFSIDKLLQNDTF